MMADDVPSLSVPSSFSACPEAANGGRTGALRVKPLALLTFNYQLSTSDYPLTPPPTPFNLDPSPFACLSCH